MFDLDITDRAKADLRKILVYLTDVLDSPQAATDIRYKFRFRPLDIYVNIC